jgi:hypothetical protein
MVKQEIKAQNTEGSAGKCLGKNWEGTIMHGRDIRSVDRQVNGGGERLVWLYRGELRGENERDEMNTLQTECRETDRILQTETATVDCKRFDEREGLVILVCPKLAIWPYVKRHNGV